MGKNKEYNGNEAHSLPAKANSKAQLHVKFAYSIPASFHNSQFIKFTEDKLAAINAYQTVLDRQHDNIIA